MKNRQYRGELVRAERAALVWMATAAMTILMVVTVIPGVPLAFRPFPVELVHHAFRSLGFALLTLVTVAAVRLRRGGRRALLLSRGVHHPLARCATTVPRRRRHAHPDLCSGLDPGEGVLRRRDLARGAGRRVCIGRAVDRRARRPRARRAAIGVVALVGTVLIVPSVLPLLPIASLHKVSGATSIADGIGWPQLTADVAVQDAALARAGQRPTSIFTGAYAEAGALDVYGRPYHLPLVISGHNTFWRWGPGDASDTTVLYVERGRAAETVLHELPPANRL